MKKVISEQEYHQAMQRIDEIFGAKQGTPEGYELEKLLVDVKAYEDKYHPMPTPTSEEIAKFRKENLKQ